jgi:hypothetical protein
LQSGAVAADNLDNTQWEGRSPVADQSVLRLFRFRVLGSSAAFDARLRDSVMPDFVGRAGLLASYVGRRGSDQSDRRVIASVWESARALAAAISASGPGSVSDERFPFESDGEEIADARIEVLPLEVALAFDPQVPVQILRIFRGEVKPGEAAEYLEDVRRGTLADVAAGHGPQALFLGMPTGSTFITLSAWANWSLIEAATGGNVRQPIATRNAARLLSGTAAHYEIIPELAGRPMRTAAPVD